MEFEKTEEPLRKFGTWLFRRVKELTGTELVLEQGSGWYRAPAAGKVCLYVLFVGKKATKNHKNSVVLSIPRNPREFSKYPWVKVGDSFFGKDTADFNARSDNSEDKSRVETFIRLAFQIPDGTPDKVQAEMIDGDDGDENTVPPPFPEPDPLPSGTSPVESSPKRKWLARIAKIAIRAIIVAILTGVGSQIGGWLGGLVTAVLSSIAALLIGDLGIEPRDA
jgi:hypothetical protein